MAQSRSPYRLLLRFLFTVAILFGIMAWPWPGLKVAYGQAFRRGAELLFGGFGRDGKVGFFPASMPGLPPPPRDSEHMDTFVLCANESKPPGDWVYGTWHDSRLIGYLPTIKLIALVMATPIAWPRRWNALFWGLLLVHAFIGARLAIVLLHSYSEPTPYQMYHLSPFWKGVLNGLHRLVVPSPLATFFAPVLIWVGVCIRRDDLARFLGQENTSKTPRK
jgi:hypothetical protein